MKDVKLFWMPYKLFPYERVLGKREIMSLLSPDEIIEEEQSLLARGCRNPETAERLVYFSAYLIDGTTHYTIQYEREQNGEKKQNTRYFAHGIHEYKGKFNPQIVRAIMNICGADAHSLILDPFCGSGTSLLEAQLQGCEAFGIDVNPMAAFIAKTKTNIIFNKEEISAFDIDGFVFDVQQYVPSISHNEDVRTEYLRRWFREDILDFIESWRAEANRIANSTIRDLLLLSMSNLLRDYSEQEPSDLRVRRRNSPYPEEPIAEAVRKSFLRSQSKISQFHIDQNASYKHAHIVNKSSSSNVFEDLPNFDLAVTSPPYATALPYIDTQRLSIVWLGIDSPKNIKALECSLTGSRETMAKREQQKWLFAMSRNTKGLCSEVATFCQTLQRQLTVNDGFRKQNTPFLLYKYFADMSQMFHRVHNILKTGTRFCLVVGYNKTNIGKPQIIDTPTLLSEEAKMQGFQVEEVIPLETYQRYGLHAKQAIIGEALIILKA